VLGVPDKNGHGTSGVSFESEKREDAKCQMLEEIDSLIESLKADDVDLDRIPKVGKQDSYEEVETVLKILRHKNDRMRYCSFAEEFIIFGACSLEELFDGKNTYFGRSPDLTDWSNQVNVKLRRMRHDTSQVMGQLMQDFNIGPGARILLELVPNMLLYSRGRKKQSAGPNLTFNDHEMSAANERLRDL
jgi:hypothetical protein